MPAPTSSPSDGAVPAGSDAFHRAVDDLLRAAPEAPACVLVTAPDEAARQEAVAAVARRTGLHLHQHDLAPLLDDDPMHTQGNLREVFDNTMDGPALLFFDHADALFAAVERQAREDHLDADARTPLDYFYDRIAAFDGIVLLGLSDPAHVARARTYGPALVVA